MKNFNEMLQVIRDLKPGESTAYIAEDVPIRACVNFWIELDEAGKVTHFSPHLNFYVEEDLEGDFTAMAVLSDGNETFAVDTQQEAIDFLQAFARQSGVDQQGQIWERDEAADM